MTDSEEPDALRLAREIADSYRSAKHDRPDSEAQVAARRSRPAPTATSRARSATCSASSSTTRVGPRSSRPSACSPTGPRSSAPRWRSTPRSIAFEDGEVEVRTDSTAWATQLRMLAPRIVAKLNEEFGDGSVLRIVVRGPQAPSWKKGLRSRQRCARSARHLRLSHSDGETAAAATTKAAVTAVTAPRTSEAWVKPTHPYAGRTPIATRNASPPTQPTAALDEGAPHGMLAGTMDRPAATTAVHDQADRQRRHHVGRPVPSGDDRRGTGESRRESAGERNDGTEHARRDQQRGTDGTGHDGRVTAGQAVERAEARGRVARGRSPSGSVS